MLINPLGVLSRSLVSLPKPSGGAAYFLHLGVHFSAAATGLKTGRRFHHELCGADVAERRVAPVSIGPGFDVLENNRSCF